MLSEEDYNNVMATFEIYNNPALYKKIQEGKATLADDCISEDEVQW